jgi:hypothetical protein
LSFAGDAGTWTRSEHCGTWDGFDRPETFEAPVEVRILREELLTPAADDEREQGNAWGGQ